MPNSTLLAGVSIGMLQLLRVDARVTANTILREKLGERAGRWNKELYPEEGKALIVGPRNAARTLYYKMTLPYPEDGWSICPAGIWYDYTDAIRKAKAKYDQGVADFIARREEWLAWAKKTHNGYFESSLYPTEQEMRDRLHFDVLWKPMPASSHFTDEMRKIVGADADRVDKEVAKALAEADKALWKRLIEPLRNLAELPRKERVHDAVLDNVREMIALAPKLVVADPGIAPFCAEIKAALKGVTIEQCKDEKARKRVARIAEDLLKRDKKAEPAPVKNDPRSVSDRLVKIAADYV